MYHSLHDQFYSQHTERKKFINENDNNPSENIPSRKILVINIVRGCTVTSTVYFTFISQLVNQWKFVYF